MQWHNYYLLTPLAPLLVILCLVIWIYEYVKLFNEERVEKSYVGSTIYVAIQLISMSILTFPLLLLGPFQSLITLPLHMLLLVPFIIGQSLIWNPLIEGIVPSAYLYWNSRVYTNLDNVSREIRVLDILPGSSSDAMKIRTLVISLDERHERPFCALSYSWGGHYMLRRVISANGQAYFVSVTVFNALRALRHVRDVRRIWIDFICINQRDEIEKQHQLYLMGSIYSMADTVFVWLGNSTADTEQAFDFIREVAEIAEERVSELRPRTESQLKAVQKLLLHRWWSRVWIVPEVTRGNRVIVRCGQFQLPWEILSAFLLRSNRILGAQIPSRLINYCGCGCQNEESGLYRPAEGLVRSRSTISPTCCQSSA